MQPNYFSAGPWTTERIDESRVAINSPFWAWHTKVVVKMRGDKDYDDSGVANMHLIAAAPDMYYALERVMHDGATAEVINHISDVLAKARGEGQSDKWKKYDGSVE